MPMRPSPSPTTVSAAKPRMRPPFTTLVTRLTAIIFSLSPSSRSSDGLPLGCTFAIADSLRDPRSELQAGFARRIRKRLDASVELESGAIERDGLDTGGLGLLRHPGADEFRGRGVAALALGAGELRAHLGLARRRRNEHLRTVGRNDARVDVQVGAVDRQPLHARQRDARTRGAGTAQTSLFLFDHASLRAYFFLVSLMTTTSSEYRTPLPL